HRGGDAVRMQYRTDIGEATIDLCVQAGFRRRLAVTGGLAIQVDNHYVGLGQVALVLAGNGDRAEVLVQALRIIGAGRRRPAMRVQAMADRSKGTGSVAKGGV